MTVTWMREIVFILISFVLTVIGVGLFRRWIIRRGILDVPNERSSHDAPTPRGGGVVIVFVTLALFVFYGLTSGTAVNWTFVGTSVVLAGIGWLDDLYSIPFHIRLLVHLTVASIFVSFVGYYQSLLVPGISTAVSFGSLGIFLSIAWIVWMINAYNFMDGIDGIAGIQGIVAGLGWSVFGIIFSSTELVLIGGTLAAASAGFLLFNWSPAKIFMGDVGSSFLGFAFAVVPLLAVSEDKFSSFGFMAYAAVAFVWLFVVDTVITLLKRILERKRFWEAHREHLYQRLVIAGTTHATVSRMYGLIAAIISAFVLLQFSYGGIFDFLVAFLLVCSPLAILIWIRTIK